MAWSASARCWHWRQHDGLAVSGIGLGPHRVPAFLDPASLQLPLRLLAAITLPPPPPLQAAHLMASGQLSRFAILLLGGAPFLLDLRLLCKRQRAAAGCRIFHGFGMTETLTHIATRPLGDRRVLGSCPAFRLRTTETGASRAQRAPRRGVHGLVTARRRRSCTSILWRPRDESARQFSWLGTLGRRHQFCRAEVSSCRAGKGVVVPCSTGF